jgi:type IV pilus biogenesis protein CpaD/CtpE
MSARWSMLVLLAAWLATLVGCATTDPENQSARPWNVPKSWETGLPSSMFEGR